MTLIYLQISAKFLSFATMNVFQNIIRRLRRNVKFSASDPINFQEIWSFNSNGLRVFSFIIFFILVYSTGLMYFTNSGIFAVNDPLSDVQIDRSKLESQREKIESLSNKISAQEAYIANIKRILNGEIAVDGPLDSIPATHTVNLDELNGKPSEVEKELSEKVKDDMRTIKKREGTSSTYFLSPVTGTVSQKFNKKDHPGVDIVTEKDKVVMACLSGTVIYTGYTRKDGYIAIIEHPGKYLSVYKHNKSVLKKNGAKVRVGDPIAIVGNTGENSSGPHLHFELWYDLTPVNPEDFMKLTR